LKGKCMKRFLPLILAAVIVLAPAAAVSAAKPPAEVLPLALALAFANPVGDSQAPSDPEVVVAVIEHLRAAGQLDVLPFNRDLPIVTRAVIERRLSQQTLNQSSDPWKAIQIAAAVGARYALCIQGSVLGSKITISLQLVKTPGGERWASISEGEIAPGGSGYEVNRSNAIMTAASSAVSQLIIAAFGEKAALDAAAAATNAATARPTDVAPAPKRTEQTRDTAAEYASLMKQAEADVAASDLPNAVMDLRRAINLKPEEPASRVQLAQIYSQMGMTAEAADECKRALLFSKDSAAVRDMLAKFYAASGALAEAVELTQEIVRLEPNNAEARLTLGDLYWNQGKVEDAAGAYEEASKLAPANPVPHERLQRLCAARKMYTQALEHLLQARMLAAGTESAGSKRYEVIGQIIQDEFGTVVGRLERAGDDYANDKIGREDYYKECKDATNRIDSLASFLSTQTVPKDYKEAYPHGVLAVSLLAQAAGYMASYLETEKRYYAEQAGLLRAEARTELNLFTAAMPKT